jgi:hypothetical protein
MKLITAGVMMLALAATNAVYAQEPSTGVLAQVKVVTGGSFGFVSDMLVGGTAVKGAPYSAQAVTETIQTLADGNRIVHESTAMVYRDSLGRERREQTLPAIGPFTAQGDSPKVISISDPVAGVHYSLNPSEHVAVKLPVAAGELKFQTLHSAAPAIGTSESFEVMVNGPGIVAAAAPSTTMIYNDSSAASTPAKTEQLGWKLIEGVQAEGTRNTITIPAGQLGNDRPIEISDEQWRSPDLQLIVLSKHSDPRMGETVYSLTNISRSEPSPALFQVPPEYTVQDKFQDFQRIAPKQRQ